MDILYAEGITLSNGLVSMELSFPELDDEDCLCPEFKHDSSLRSVLSIHAVLLVRVHLFSFKLKSCENL